MSGFTISKITTNSTEYQMIGNDLQKYTYHLFQQSQTFPAILLKFMLRPRTALGQMQNKHQKSTHT